MNSWSRTRKRIILLLVFSAVIILIGVPIFFLFYQAPTCFDDKLNGDETGVDCGGSCQLLCSAESLPLIMKGDPRILTIASSTYEIVALIDNPNNQGEIYRVGYKFSIYSNTNPIPIKVIEGETYIPKGETFVIFEGPFVLEEREVPARATLEWRQESLTWQRSAREKPELRIKDAGVSRDESSPRLEAVLQNFSLESVANIDLVAVISDSTGNIFAASKTFVDTLKVGEEIPIIFSWPRPFASQAADIDIYVRVLPDRSFLR